MYMHLKLLLGCAWLDRDGSVHAVIPTCVEVGVQTNLATPCVLVAHLPHAHMKQLSQMQHRNEISFKTPNSLSTHASLTIPKASYRSGT